MTEKRLLALIAVLIGLVGGLLLLSGALDISRSQITLNLIANALIGAVLGIAILAGSLLIYRGRYGSGGVINIFLGVVVLILALGTTGGILAVVSGVLGFIASGSGRERERERT